MARRFEIDDAIARRYSPCNATGTQLTARLLPPLMTTKEILLVIF